MKTVPVTQFKDQCFRLLEEVSRTGESIRITKRGKVLAEINPPAPKDDYTPGRFAGSAVIVGDLMAPLDVEWEALK